MKGATFPKLALLLVLIALLCISPAVADEPPITAQAAVGPTFTYQGHLLDNSAPANGTYDFLFRLYDGADPIAATQVGTDVALEDVTVSNGLFTVSLDFGAAPFNGQALWLQVSVRPGASADPHTALSPTTALNAAPYALSLRPGATISGSGLGISVSSNNGTAILAQNTGAGLFPIGVWGNSTVDGLGVLGSSDSGTGVYATSTSGMAFRASGTHSGSATVANHIALIENTNTSNNADVLAIKIGTAVANTGSANNLITFFAGGDAEANIIGRIESNAAHTISFSTGSGDYGEWLPRLDPAEAIEPGDIVGVFAGKVSKATAGADQLLVVSSGAAVAANSPGEEQEAACELVAFIGQVPVQVRGPVTAGDFIIPSGLDDGSGIAVAPAAITPEQFAQVVGQAWESASDPGLKSVTVAVGLVQRDPTIARLLEQVQSQEARLAAIEARLAQLEAGGE